MVQRSVGSHRASVGQPRPGLWAWAAWTPHAACPGSLCIEAHHALGEGKNILRLDLRTDGSRGPALQRGCPHSQEGTQDPNRPKSLSSQQISLLVSGESSWGDKMEASSVLPTLLLVCCYFVVSEGGAGLGSTDPGAEHPVHLRPLTGPARTARILCPQDQSPTDDLG